VKKENHINEICIEFKIKEKVDLNTIFELNKIKLIGEAKIIKYGNSTSCTNIKDEKINIYNYLCSVNANKLFLIYNYIKFDNDLYIWTEKYGWKSKSMCCGMIKPIHLLLLGYPSLIYLTFLPLHIFKKKNTSPIFINIHLLDDC